MNVDYIPILEVAKAAGCTVTTIRNYIKMAEKSETHLPFPDTIVLYDGNNGRPTRAIRAEDAIVFANWYKKFGGKRGSCKALGVVKNVEEEKKKRENATVLKSQLSALKKEVTKIGVELMNLLTKIDEIEKRL